MCKILRNNVIFLRCINRHIMNKTSEIYNHSLEAATSTPLVSLLYPSETRYEIKNQTTEFFVVHDDSKYSQLESCTSNLLFLSVGLRLQVKMQKMRSNLGEKMLKRMALVQRRAEEWRAAALSANPWSI